MPSSYPAPVTRIEGETLSLSTTRASLGLPRQHHQFILYDPVEDYRVHLNPALIDVVFFDNSAAANSKYSLTGGTGINLLLDLTDRLEFDKGTGTKLDDMQTADFLYLCFADVIGGFRVDMTASVNSTANTTMTVAYRKNDDTWASVASLTDGTSSSVSLDQDGDVTFTAPTDWKAAQLIGPNTESIVSSDLGEPVTRTGFWLRIDFDEVLDADTEIDEIWAINRDTNRGYFRSATEYAFSVDRRIIGSIEGVTTANTDTLQISYVRTIQ